jgi:hypothetical protein
MTQRKADAVGRHIRTLIELRGISGRKDLYNRLLEVAKKQSGGDFGQNETKKSKQTLTPQTVSNWIGGKVVPGWEWIPLLAEVFEVPEEEIVFGSKRGEQLKKDRQYLARITDEEALLLTAFRDTSKAGQKTILRQAKVVADEHPAPEATVHLMRRRDDRTKS